MELGEHPIGEAKFDLADSDHKMWVRVFAPVLQPDGQSWACRFAIGAPLSIDDHGLGEDSLLALVEAFRGLSRAIYGSAAYRSKLIGVDGDFGGDLFIPATCDMLDVAPFPF